jgi:Protein-L-isoaspartate(D-aspartate) O-methyltransferase (PCMT)
MTVHIESPLRSDTNLLFACLGIEIHADAIEHCMEAISEWKRESPAAREIQHIEVIHGNALDLNFQIGECALGFDRIYIGAAIESHQLPLFKRLLKPGGILIGPVDGDLMKVVRLQTPMNDEEFRHENLSAVRFAPLLSHPQMETVIAARVWNPALHRYYPDGFRDSCKALLMCTHAAYQQPLAVELPPEPKVNVACMLPRALWFEVLSFTHRDCKFQT